MMQINYEQSISIIHSRLTNKPKKFDVHKMIKSWMIETNNQSGISDFTIFTSENNTHQADFQKFLRSHNFQLHIFEGDVDIPSLLPELTDKKPKGLMIIGPSNDMVSRRLRNMAKSFEIMHFDNPSVGAEYSNKTPNILVEERPGRFFDFSSYTEIQPAHTGLLSSFRKKPTLVAHEPATTGWGLCLLTLNTERSMRSFRLEMQTIHTEHNLAGLIEKIEPLISHEKNKIYLGTMFLSVATYLQHHMIKRYGDTKFEMWNFNQCFKGKHPAVHFAEFINDPYPNRIFLEIDGFPWIHVVKAVHP
jgi:hypothetical protein